MIKKLNGRLIITECFALFFLIYGVKTIHTATQSKVYEAIIAGESIEGLTDLTLGEVLTHQVFWPLGAFFLGVLVLAVINRIYRTSILNTILIFVVVFSLFPLGIIFDGFLSQLFNSFCFLFSEKIGTAFYTGGIIITLISIGLFWRSITLNKRQSSTSTK